MKKRYLLVSLFLISLLLSFAPYYRQSIVCTSLNRMCVEDYDTLYVNSNSLKLISELEIRKQGTILVSSSKDNFFRDFVVPNWDKLYDGNPEGGWIGMMEIEIKNFGFVQTVSY